eukprot:760413-Rhodomonas_salina.1
MQSHSLSPLSSTVSHLPPLSGALHYPHPRPSDGAMLAAGEDVSKQTVLQSPPGAGPQTIPGEDWAGQLLRRIENGFREAREVDRTARVMIGRTTNEPNLVFLGAERYAECGKGTTRCFFDGCDLSEVVNHNEALLTWIDQVERTDPRMAHCAAGTAASAEEAKASGKAAKSGAGFDGQVPAEQLEKLQVPWHSLRHTASGLDLLHDAARH